MSSLWAEMRPWKDSSGTRTIQAEFLSRTATSVVLRKADGKTHTIPINKLHESEQTYLEKKHPFSPAGKKPEVLGNAFGPLDFGDSRDEVEEKLVNSSIVKTSVKETFFGRTGLNGIFQTTHDIGGKHCFLYFEWSESGNLDEITLRTEPLSESSYNDSLRSIWSEFIEFLNKLYGKPISISPYPEKEKLEHGLMLGSHLWRTDDGYSVLLGPSKDLEKYNVSVRFTTKRIQPITIP